MRKPSSLIFSISLLLLSGLSVAQTDSLKAKRNHFFVDLNYGVTVYNKLTLDNYIYNIGDSYDVNSKVKSNYDLSFTYLYRHLRLSIGANYLQSEFKGLPFIMGTGDIPYKSSSYPYSYNMVQRVQYNVLYSNVGIGYQTHLRPKHTISVDLMFHVPTKYIIKIDNQYAPGNQPSDTTLFSASKHSYNNQKDFGWFPRFSCKLSYCYYFYKNLAVNCNLSLMYCHTQRISYPEFDDPQTVFNNSNRYSYLVYEVREQMILIPSIGIKYRIK